MGRHIRLLTLAAAATVLLALAGAALQAGPGEDQGHDDRRPAGRRARNVIFFVGDGMGVSTVTATRVFSVGVAGELAIDTLPYTALSRTYSSDSITADSAPTMTAMMTGHNTNGGVIGLDETTEVRDFNRDGDGASLWTLLEQAKDRSMRVGVVSTARVTHATPAATYAHVNNRDNENAIALQALPGDAAYNSRLGAGIDLLMGGGRQFFVPTTMADEEGGSGSRPDGRDLRAEFRGRGYSYVWNTAGFNALTPANLPVLGLFERSHMEYELDSSDAAGGRHGRRGSEGPVSRLRGSGRLRSRGAASLRRGDQGCCAPNRPWRRGRGSHAGGFIGQRSAYRSSSWTGTRSRTSVATSRSRAEARRLSTIT